MSLFLISRIFVHAENDFNQIKENFLDSQRETDANLLVLARLSILLRFQFSTRNLSFKNIQYESF